MGANTLLLLHALPSMIRLSSSPANGRTDLPPPGRKTERDAAIPLLGATAQIREGRKGGGSEKAVPLLFRAAPSLSLSVTPAAPRPRPDSLRYRRHRSRSSLARQQTAFISSSLSISLPLNGRRGRRKGEPVLGDRRARERPRRRNFPLDLNLGISALFLRFSPSEYRAEGGMKWSFPFLFHLRVTKRCIAVAAFGIAPARELSKAF